MPESFLRMKILFLLSRVPYALDKGDKLRAFYQLKALAQNHEVILFALSDEPVPAGAEAFLRTICSDVLIFPLSRVQIVQNILQGILRGLPIQASYFYNHLAQQALDAFIQKHQPEHLYCQLVRMAEYTRRYPDIPKILDYMDALSKAMERRGQLVSFIQKPFFAFESKRLQHYETEVLDWFNYQTIISEQDRQYLQHPQKYNVHIVPNGVDAVHFYPVPHERPHQILFVGNLHYPPNIAAARFLVKQIMPRVWAHNPAVQVLLAGRQPTAAITALASEKVRVLADLPDIREAYACSQLFVAPLFYGTGMQNKILEAMAMGLPCLTTHLVNNAIRGIKNRQVMLAESAPEFARHILHLLHSPQEADRLGQEGRRLVQKQYDWESLTNRLEALLQLPALV
jgi:sugar transferase (PEP-CTERM/EpsH1 system associated)